MSSHTLSGLAGSVGPSLALPSRARRAVVLAAGGSIVALGLPAAAYLGTLLPGLGHSGDSAELSTCARLLAVPHATGYPLYVAIVHLFGRLLPVSPALAANLFSALCAFSTLLVGWRLLARLGADGPARLAAIWTLAAAPTFWLHAIVAEVYALHALLLAVVALLFVRWAQARRERDFYGACFVYALAFGNHLLMVTLLPAVVALVLAVRPRCFLEPRRLLLVGAIVGSCAAQYALLPARAADGAAAYRGAPINGPGELLAFVTGAAYRDSMFAFTARELLSERLPRYVDSAIHDLGPLALFAPLGAVALGRSPLGVFLLLAFAGNLVFALGYDISDVKAYFIPNHLFGALFLGVGLAATLRHMASSSPRAARTLATLALALPVFLGAVRLPRVVTESGRDAAARAQAILADAGRGAVVIAEYPTFQYMLYYQLVEGRAPSGPLLAHESVELGELIEYLRDGKPLAVPTLGRSIPPGLEVYSDKLFAPRRYQRAGLTIEPWHHDLYRISYSNASGR